MDTPGHLCYGLRMTNTESKTTPLQWTRIKGGEYTTRPDNRQAGYRVYRSPSSGGWYAWTPAEGGKEKNLGIGNTLAEAKSMCDQHAATPTPATSTPTEWVEQLIALLDADTDVRFTRDADLIVNYSPVATNLDRVRQAAHAAIELGICEAVPQIDLSERVQLTDRFRQERAESRGIVPGAIVQYRSPMALRPNELRWEVVEIEGEYVRVVSPQGTRSAWPVERAVLADRHGYREMPDGLCHATIADRKGDPERCERPAGHPVHL